MSRKKVTKKNRTPRRPAPDVYLDVPGGPLALGGKLRLAKGPYVPPDWSRYRYDPATQTVIPPPDSTEVFWENLVREKGAKAAVAIWDDEALWDELLRQHREKHKDDPLR